MGWRLSARTRGRRRIRGHQRPSVATNGYQQGNEESEADHERTSA